VQGKSGLDRMSIGAAKRSDLSPCRVCDPDALDAPPEPEEQDAERSEEPATV
jgi:hypothetical protein